MGGNAGSKVLVTTRIEDIVQTAGEQHIIRVKMLSEEDCWLLLRGIAFVGNQGDLDYLEPIGKKIVHKCDGLPLAVKTLGWILDCRNSKEDWLQVLWVDLWNLEYVKKSFFNVLLLSYYDLSPVERRCFSYCAIFPRDYKMEREDLIQQWMAQGYFNLSITEAELTGQECFDNLAMRSLLQDFEYDDVSSRRIKSFKMHGIVHDFLQYLARNKYAIISITTATPKVLHVNGRHLNLMFQPEVRYSISVSSGEKLHTLMVSSPATSSFPTGLSDFKCLKSLSLTLEYSFRLPNGIGDLIHLRYLCILAVGYEIVLPAKTGDLFNLQTLRLDCQTILPKQIGKLINLRHLYTHKCINFRWPKAVGKLKGLQTGDVIRSDNEDNVFQLRDLERMDKKEVEEARQARLNKKMELVNLKLKFGRKANDQQAEIHKNVLEALWPHEGLRYLGINDYLGCLILPSWLTQLTGLQKLELTKCDNCESLPLLGKLPDLESLTISALRSLKSLGPEFLGIEIENGTCDNNGPVVSFRELKELKLDQLNALSEWNDVPGWRENGLMKIMPHIENVFISKCLSLRSLPDFLVIAPLKKLVIESCPELDIKVLRGDEDGRSGDSSWLTCWSP